MINNPERSIKCAIACLTRKSAVSYLHYRISHYCVQHHLQGGITPDQERWRKAYCDVLSGLINPKAKRHLIMNYETYHASQEASEMGKCLDSLIVALQQTTNRAHEGFIAYYSGKDSDLDSSGAFGIERIASVDDENITLFVKAVATICPPYEIPRTETEREANALAQEQVTGCNYHGEWSGDDWFMVYRQLITVAWRFTNNELDFGLTAQAISKAAADAVAPFQEEMKKINANIDQLAKEE